MAIQNGVRAIRTHVDIDPVTGLEGFRAVADVREELKAEVAIQIVAFPQDGFGPDDEVLALMRQALAEGADLVGGIPARDADPLRHIDRLCRLAKESAVPVDMHVDESDDPADFTLPLVIDRVRHYGLQGRCTVGHLCSLSAVPDQQAAETIAQAAACGISVITLPSTNLYLQGRGDRGLIRRGTTRINELLAAGVRVAAGGDNLRDPFNPFGNANPLETAWLLAHVAHMGGARAMEQAFAMVSDDAAGLLGITDWELKPGTAADFLLLPVQSRAEALVSLAKPSYRVRKGQVC
jgi:cytosine deaminase